MRPAADCCGSVKVNLLYNNYVVGPRFFMIMISVLFI